MPPAQCCGNRWKRLALPLRSQARQILRKLNHHSPLKMCIDSGEFFFRCVHKHSRGAAARHVCGALAHSYVIEDGICYLTLARKSFSRKQAFGFLVAVKAAFVGDLQTQHGAECVPRHAAAAVRAPAPPLLSQVEDSD